PRRGPQAVRDDGRGEPRAGRRPARGEGSGIAGRPRGRRGVAAAGGSLREVHVSTNRFAVCLAAVWGLAATTLPAAEYAIDSDHSHVQFSVPRFGSSTVPAQFM